MAQRSFFFLIALIFSQIIIAQSDPVLFSVEDTPIHRSEFEYIYSKTNGPEANFSEASLQEYLDLYVNFKLKVQKAKEMKLDTIKSLQQELDGYRRQLADSYLIDREVTEKLVKEAYERSKQDVDISHIMVNVPSNASPMVEQKAKEKIMRAMAELEGGGSFADVAKKYSEDKSVSKNQGHVGWVTPLFPNGFYELETAAYSAQIGKAVGPVRTSAGYHILKVNERRPARGEVEVSHILVRVKKDKSDLEEGRKKIHEAYGKLQSGEEWDAVAKEYSTDKITAGKGGYLGYFGINRYEKAFEDAAFGLQNNGDYTKPIESSIGWHIIKRLDRKSDLTFQQARGKLQNDIKKDARFELAKKAMVDRIIAESNFQENRTTLDQFITTLEQDTAKTFLTYKWKATQPLSKKPLFSFGDNMKINLGDFEGFLQRNSRKRQQGRGKGIKATVEELYQNFIADSALAYEEQQLDKKYPEFKSLMREYEEGVLLFEVTKMEVWDKASEDTVGLAAFYDKNKGKYQWGERALLSQYSLVERQKQLSNQVRDFAKTHNPEEVLAKFNTPEDSLALTMRTKTFEKGRNELLDKMKWKVGELSPTDINKRNKSLNFFKIEEIKAPAQKTLKEARGYVVADYQDYLEVEWLKQLKSEYDVNIDKKVLKSLVKK